MMSIVWSCYRGDLRFPSSMPRTPQIKLLMQSERNMFTEKVVGSVVFSLPSSVIIRVLLRSEMSAKLARNLIKWYTCNLDDGSCINVV